MSSPPPIPPTRITPVHGRSLPGGHRRMRLGEALVAAGVITELDLAACLAEQQREPAGRRRRLGDIVVAAGLADEADIARGLAAMLGFEYVDLAAVEIAPAAVRLVPRATATRLRALPVAAGETWLRVAVADPTDRTAIDVLRQAVGVPSIALVVATPSGIAAALERHWSAVHTPAPPATPAAAPPSPAPAVPTVAAARPDPAPPAEFGAEWVPGGWEYLLVGDGLPLEHPGYTSDVPALEDRLAGLGADGWEAVGIHANGARMRVLLKRARY